MARIPRSKTDAPFLTAYSTVKPSKVSIVTFEKSAVMASSIFRRSDTLNNGSFSALRRMATVSSSKILLPRSIKSRWPLVGGSDEPG